MINICCRLKFLPTFFYWTNFFADFYFNFTDLIGPKNESSIFTENKTYVYFTIIIRLLFAATTSLKTSATAAIVVQQLLVKKWWIATSTTTQTDQKPDDDSDENCHQAKPGIRYTYNAGNDATEKKRFFLFRNNSC